MITTASEAGFRAFWAEAGWGDVWHQVRKIKVGSRTVTSVHSGLDIPTARGARRPIPALAAGVVTEVGRLPDVGGFVEVQVGPTLWHTYCHVIPDITSRAGLVKRQNLARVASARDNPGTLWTGDHLHFMVARQPGAVRRRKITVDPAGYVRIALTATSIPPIADAITDPEKESGDMPDYDYIVQTGEKRWALGHPTLIPGGVRETTSQAEAESWNAATGLTARQVSAKAWPKAIAGMQALAALAREAAPTAAGSGPTAAEIAAAVRAELGGALTAP